MKKITHFYFDMDGVLTDFPSYVKEHCPYTHDEYTIENRERFKGWLSGVIDKDKVFFNLPPSPYLEDMKKLMNVLIQNGVVVSTLTSLGGHYHNTSIHAQKKEWLDKHGLSHILYLTVNECHEKKYLAHETAFLLDDKPDNCFDFIQHGGMSMLYSINEHNRCKSKMYDKLFAMFYGNVL